MEKNRNRERIISIVGPTACGKTGKAVALAEALGGEIISADSRQIYRGMDLGTGKDLEEYGAVPYHLIDICDAGEKYNLHRYLSDFRKVLEDVRSRGVLPIVCGGTGMYVENALAGIRLPEVPENADLRASLQDKTLPELEAILREYKTLHNTTDVDTVKRAVRAIEIAEYYRKHPEEAALTDKRTATPEDALIVMLDISREDRRARITRRLQQRLEAGMLDEIRQLLDSGVKAEDLIYYGLEYKYLTLHVIGQMSYDEMFTRLEMEIHKFAKRQMTWFRGMEKRGFTLHHLPYDMPDSEFVEAVKDMYR